jgi:hypothetical protein
MTAAGARRGLARHQLPEGTRAVLTQRIDGAWRSATSPSTTPPGST